MDKRVSKLKQTQFAYRAVFRDDKGLNPCGKEVLADLRLFCNGTKSCFDADPIKMARNAARQEVFQRIMNFLQIDYADYYELDDYDIFNN